MIAWHLLPTTSRSLALIPHSETTCRPHFVPTHEMDGQSGSARFQARFESTLQAYRKITGVTLAEHQAAVRLQNCDSVESITTLLLYEARAFSDFRGFDRITRAIQGVISILSTLCATASLGDAIGLVRQKALLASRCRQTLTAFLSLSHPREQYRLALRSYLLYVPLFRSYMDILVTFK